MANGNTKNVAIEPDLHRRIRMAVAASGETIVEFAARALESALPPAFRKKPGKGTKA